MGWVDQTPLWIIGLLSLASLAAAYELGHRGARALSRRHGRTDGQKGHLIAAALSLSGLMMAFTFGAAQADFRQRQEMVIAEANALETTYLRIQLLAPVHREPLDRQIRRYAEVRGAFYRASGRPAELTQNTASTATLQAGIWSGVHDAIQTNATPTLNGPLLESVTHLFHMAAARRAAEEMRIPGAVLLMLVVTGFVTAPLVAFGGAGDRRYAVVTGAVLFVQVMAFCLILSLDRPGSRAVGINQAPMERALHTIRQGAMAAAPRH